MPDGSPLKGAKRMRLLAFETSAKAASVALLEEGKLLAEQYQNTGLTHSQYIRNFKNKGALGLPWWSSG